VPAPSTGVIFNVTLLYSMAKQQQMTWRLMLSVLSGTLGASLQFGFSTGFVNNMEVYVMHYFQNRGLASRTCHLEDASTDCAEFRFWWSVAVSGFAMGGLVGTFVFPTLANKIGRKRTILSTSVFCYLSCYLIAFPSSWWMLILGRILVGIGAGGACGAVPTYITEIAPNDLRGTLGTVHQLMITIGILTSQALSTTELHLLGEDSRWQYSLLVPFACTTFLVITLPFCAESPPFLLQTKGEQACKDALMWFRRKDYDQKRFYREIRHMKQEMELADKTASVGDVLKDELLWKPMLVGTVVNLSMQFSGIDAVFYYSTSVFVSAGIDLNNAQLATTLVGLCNVLVTIPAMFMMDKAGRKVIQAAGLGGMCLSYVLMTVALVCNLHMLSVVAMVLIICFFAFGPGCIAWFIIAELVPIHARGVATSVALGVNWVANWFIAFVFPHILMYLGRWTFVVFVVSTFSLMTYTIIFLPETKGKTVMEIRETFSSSNLLTSASAPNLAALGQPFLNTEGGLSKTKSLGGLASRSVPNMQDWSAFAQPELPKSVQKPAGAGGDVVVVQTLH